MTSPTAGVHVESVLPRDAIPSIDDPTFESSYFGEPEDDVIVVEASPPRAYPVRVLSYHEIVNDVVEDSPLAITWCPICWSAMVYERTIDDTVLTFGTSGKLADDALVMYDRETESEWKQPTGTAIAGPLEARRLTPRPTAMIPWKRFVAEYPDGVVLQGRRSTDVDDATRAAEYSMVPYDGYRNGDEFGLYGMRGEGRRRSWDRSDVAAKTRVVGVELGDAAIAYPLPTLQAVGGAITDSLDGHSMLVTLGAGHGHAFAWPGWTYTQEDGAVIADGTSWDPTTGASTDGRRLERLPCRRMFAFAWQDAHGPDAFYQEAEE